MNKLYLLLLILTIFHLSADELYFPPLVGDEWESVSPESLNWDTEKIEDLYQFLDKSNSNAFILLKDGKIILEKYFNTFTKTNSWYWASAGKTLTASLVGIAQEEGLLNINDKTSQYIGEGWTSMPKEKEDLITIRHQLTMTTGLDYEVDDVDCTEPDCLKYKADAGTQWFYHNSPYTLLEKVVESATSLDYNVYTGQKLKNKIGMNGAWIKTGFNNVYYSSPRSMARFGLLMLNNGDWGGTEIIKDKNYIQEMINTSQELNKSYGYLWWLNGKESYMIPGTDRVFVGDAMPDTPDDMYAALGKNGQILNVCPSKGIVFVRMGDRPDDQFFISTIFNNEIWQYLNEIMDEGTSVSEDKSDLNISPNPASEYIEISFDRWTPLARWSPSGYIKIYNTFGVLVLSDVLHLGDVGHLKRIDISHLPIGIYFLQVGNYSAKFVVVR